MSDLGPNYMGHGGSDIVERLRHPRTTLEHGVRRLDEINTLRDAFAAADEIERLRAQLRKRG